jgi:prepilin-type N-terminal cleavage/methylation domain-containing protein
MSRLTTRRARRRPGGAARRGHTLIEAMVTIVITGVLASFGIPKFQLSLEQTRANVAGANLRAIWSAQRLYWLEYRYYAPDLNTLQSANLIDPGLASGTTYYTYVVTPTSYDASQNVIDFTATATRTGTPSWSGSFTIDSAGNLTGQVQQGGQGPTIPATSLP